MSNKERPTQQQREAVAQDIKEGGPAATETLMEEIGLTEDTPILDEADKEREEGGGPVAAAVDQLDKEAEADVDD